MAAVVLVAVTVLVILGIAAIAVVQFEKDLHNSISIPLWL